MSHNLITRENFGHVLQHASQINDAARNLFAACERYEQNERIGLESRLYDERRWATIERRQFEERQEWLERDIDQFAGDLYVLINKLQAVLSRPRELRRY